MAYADLLSQFRSPANFSSNPYQAAVQQRIASAAPTLADSGTGIGNAQIASQGLSDLQGSPSSIARQGLSDLGEGGFMTPEALGQIGTNFALPFAGAAAGGYWNGVGRNYLKNTNDPTMGQRFKGATDEVFGNAVKYGGTALGGGNLPFVSKVPVLRNVVGAPLALGAASLGALVGGHQALQDINSNETAEGRVNTPQLEKFNKQLVDNAHKISDQDYATIYKQARASLDSSVPASKRNAALKDLNKQFNAALAAPGSVGQEQVAPIDPNTVMQQQLAIAQLMKPYTDQVTATGNQAQNYYSKLASQGGPYADYAAIQAQNAPRDSATMAAAMAGQAQTLPYANQILQQNAQLQRLMMQMAAKNNAGTGSLTALTPTANTSTQ